MEQDTYHNNKQEEENCRKENTFHLRGFTLCLLKMNLIIDVMSYSCFLNRSIFLSRCVGFNRFYTSGKFDFPENQIEIQTCGELYKTWKREKMFRKLPVGNLIFNVSFIDTRPDFPNKYKENPTVLALHGSPGSWKDYTLLTSFLHERGYRVIAPSFPGKDQLLTSVPCVNNNC